MKLNHFKFVYVVIVLLVIALGVSVTFNVIGFRNKNDKSMENIIFFGDSLTARYDLEKFYSNKYIINKGINGNQTEDLLNRIDEDVYEYNPSKVILLIGINDLINEVDAKDVLLNIETIINEIRFNRPSAKIYVESLYPVDEQTINAKKGENQVDVFNKDIKTLNGEIEKMCKSNRVTYINMFDILVDNEGKLKKMYSKDGIHLTNLGYLKVTSVLNKYVGK